MKLNTLKLLTWLSNATPESSEASSGGPRYGRQCSCSREEHLTRANRSFNNQIKQKELATWRMKQK